MRTKTILAFTFLTLGLAAGSAQAAVVGGSACSTYLNGASAASLTTANVTLNGFAASDCFGHAAVDKNGLEKVIEFANDTPVLGGGWSSILRYDSANDASGYQGLLFSFTDIEFGAADLAFTLTILDQNLSTPPSLPVTMDLLFTLKGANYTDFFLFDDIVLNASNGGSYRMSIINNGDQIADLSHITLAGRDLRDDQQCAPGDPTCTPQQIPEPATLLLASAALLGAGFARRRRSS